jgi:hypothetical protein
MPRRAGDVLWLGLGAFLLAADGATARVTLEAVAVAGQHAPGTPAGAVFSLPSPPVLNDHGEVAFQARLETGPGGVGSGDDDGIWLLDRTGTLRLVAREGDPAPGTPSGRSYGQILGTTGVPRLNAQGHVAFYGSYKQSATSTVLAVFGPSGAADLTLLAAASLVWGSAPGVPLSSFASFERPSLNDTGEVVFLADLLDGLGGVTSQDDGGMWGTLSGGALALLYREDDTAPVEAGGARWAAFRPPRLNGAGQLAFWASLRGSGVDEYNPYTHWGPGPGGALSLLSRTGELEPPGVEPGETPASLSSPELAGDGAIAFWASLYTTPGTAYANFGPDGAASHTLLTREGGQAPGLPPGALFSLPGFPSLNDAGDVAFQATLAVDGSIVGADDNEGIWGAAAGEPLALLAREGEPAGDLGPGVLYRAFESVALSPAGDVVFIADLVQGSGGVTAADDRALFLLPRGGSAVALLREGESVSVAPGDLRSVSAFELYDDELRSDDRDLVVNARQQVALRATFADGSRGVLLAALEPAASVPSAAPWTVGLLAVLLAASGARGVWRRAAPGAPLL